MESMRHLSTSLPRTRRQQDQSDLLTDFKAAALSVTNLYKSAAADQVKARSAGYQDALDDLLTFLDRENLGLMDGEGWRVRQWATERLVDEGGARLSASEDEEEGNSNVEQQQQQPQLRQQADEARDSSPEVSRKQPSVPAPSVEHEEASRRRKSTSEPPHQQQQQQQQQQHTTQFAIPSTQDFSFRSPQAYPHPQTHPMDLDSSTNTAPSPPPPDTIRVIPRPPRTKHSNHHNNRRANTATTTLNFNLGSGAGNKRRLPYSDFFDISGLQFDGHDKRDGGGRGGKRTRYT